MRVLFDGQVFSMQRSGGITRYFIELWKVLGRREGFALDVFAGLHISSALQEERKRLPVRVRGIYHPHIPGTFQAALRANRFWMERAMPAADLLHPTYFFDPPRLNGNARQVITVYDMIHERFPDLLPASDPTRYYKRRAVERADIVFSISQQTKDDLIEFYGLPADRILVTPLSGNLPVHQGSLALEPFLLYVGSRSGYKNFAALLKAFALHGLAGDFKLVVFGGGPASREELEMAAGLGVLDRVLFTGGSDEKLSLYYQHAALFVYPSLYEGFGLPILEAMSHGCPTALSDVAPLRETGGSAAVYFDPASPENIADTIRRLLADTARLNDLRTAGRAHAATYSWERCADLTAGAYAALGGRS